MPADSVLVEFIRFDVWNAKASEINGDSKLLPAHYAAFVLGGGKANQIALIDLGEANPIDKMIKNFRQSPILGGVRAPAPLDSSLASENAEKKLAEFKALGQDLYAKLIEPLAAYLTPKRQIFLAPDGELSCMPFHLLPSKNKSYLMEDYALRYITVGRDLLRFQATRASFQPTTPIVLADPDYNLSYSGKSIEILLETPEHDLQGFEELRSNGKYFFPLPGTRIEGEVVAAKLGVEPHLNANAFKRKVSQCRSPYILHMATHGYFLEDIPFIPTDLIYQHWGLFSKNLGQLGRIALQNPSARSGLAFAGANTTLRGGSLPSEAEDGILTTQDAAGLNLLGTQLVVASACNTALGDMLTGEGVLGLRRAFVLAGAQTLVISLWKVNDIATAILMEQFYDNLLVHKMGRAEALEQAQYHVRDLTIEQMCPRWLTSAAIESFRGQSPKTADYLEELSHMPDNHQPFESPKYWGAFICQGNPTPLPDFVPVT